MLMVRISPHMYGFEIDHVLDGVVLVHILHYCHKTKLLSSYRAGEEYFRDRFQEFIQAYAVLI